MFLFYIPGVIIAHVAGEGNDTTTCGSERTPCKTIYHVINIRYPLISILRINLLSSINETNTTTRSRFNRNLNISINGEGREGSAINVKADLLFDTGHKGYVYWDVHVTFTNVVLNVKDALFKISTSSRRNVATSHIVTAER